MDMESKTLPLNTRPPVATPSQKKGLSRRLRPWILSGVVSVIVMQIVALSPSSVEETRDANLPIDPEVLVPKAKTTLATGIPSDRVPEYSVDQFNYVSTHGSIRDWNLIADRAYMYNRERLVHARVVKANLYDPDERITVVTGREARYLMVSPSKTDPAPVPTPSGAGGQRDLEIFGNVKTVFPDGFAIQSEYMRYRPDRRIIEIPTSYQVTGQGKDEKSGQIMSFVSQGLHYDMQKGEITLTQNVTVQIETPPDKNIPRATPRMDSKTTIESDHCVIDRGRQLAKFTMSPSRPLNSRFVLVNQPTMFSKGRRGDLNYGTSDEPLHYIVLYEDVLLKETGKGSLRYATAGRADFDAPKDIVILTEYPQVYQERDTVTGDRIILHRDTDIVEVEHSNAFSQGDQQGPKKD